MAVAGQPIEAVLTLNANSFHTGIADAQGAVQKFVGTMTKNTGEVSAFSRAVENLVTTLKNVELDLTKFTNQAKGVESFNKFANGVKALATSVELLGNESKESSVGLERVRGIITSLEGTFGTAKVEVTGLANALKELNTFEQQNAQQSTRSNQATANLRNSYMDAKNTVMAFARALNSENASLLTVTNGIRQYDSALTVASNHLAQHSTKVNMAKTSLISLEEIYARLNPTINPINKSLATMNAQFEKNRVEVMRMITGQEEATAVLERNSQAMRRNAQEKLRAMGYTGKLSVEEEKLSASTTKATTSTQRNASAMSQSTARTNQLTSATSRLGKAMSSLRMMGSLVGSMLAYNFAHKLLVATGETIHAKSEMEGYFKMLNFGQRDIDGFNNALDRTVAQFQRVNKYSLGETISSIGVEFNLSTKEMEKAMKVTSMITSEYLRAGRNANEASLAVKDVLQGQFQRLSRETGVKGEQLKEAGWSGDTSDVLGLMEALEKVGKSRNWDVFAEKANSLNDILTITQNRFGEWSADLVYSIQPAIVGAFNMIMGTAQKFASVMSGVWDWLNGDGIESNIAKWGLLGSAITTVLGILVAYRTGAGLLQVAQMGLTRTIASTILGLNAEQVALYGTRTAIMSKIFGLEAEKVATLSTRDAILSKILGLDAEVVAQEGLKSAILTSSFARELEQLQTAGATEEEIANTFALYQNQLAQKSTIGLLSAQALGLNMTTYATHGFTVALLEANTGMKASQIASMGLIKKIALLGASFVAPVAIVGAFAVALGIMAYKMNESAKEMERFNDILKNGENIVNENRETVQYYTEQQAKLKDQLAKTKEGTAEYYEIQEKLRNTNQALTTSNENLANSYKALQVANSAQKHYEQALTDMAIEHQGNLAKAYMDAGYSAVEAYEMANDSLLDAQAGAEQLRVTLQKIAQLQYKGEQNVAYLLDEFSENNVDKDKQKPYLERAESLNDKMRKAMEKGMTDESFMGRMDGWLSYYQYQIENWINNVGAMFEAKDWGAVFDNVWKGIAHGFADLPIIKDFWNWVYDQIGVKQYAGKGWSAFTDAFFNNMETISDMFKNNSFIKGISAWFESLAQLLEDPFGTLGIQLPKFDIWKLLGLDTVSAEDGSSHPEVADEMYQVIVQPIVDWWNGFMADPLSYIGNGLQYTGIGSLISALMGVTGGMDLSWAWDYLNNNVIIPLQTQFNMFLADPLSYIGGAVMSTGIGGLINALIPNDGGASILNWVNTSIIQPMTLGIQTGIASIPIIGDIAQMLGLIPQQNPNAQDKGTQLMRAMGNAITNTIAQIPILSDILRMLGLIPQANPTASSNGRGVGDAIKTGFKNGLNGIVDIIKNELDHIINAIRNKIDEAKSSAIALGNAVVSGVRSAIDPGSPGIIARSIIGNEFGIYIPQKIADGIDLAYSTAQSYGQSIKDGISSVNLNSFGTFATDYESDAQMINATTQMMGMDTTTAFNDMSMAVNSTTSSMGANVTSTYTSMQTKQSSMLNTMKTQNTSAYNDMYQKSNQSLIHMRDSTSNITHQMTNAWNTMKNNIVQSAHQLQHDSTVHFNTLSNTIGSFYRKIQNPSSWGAGSGSSTPVRTSRNPTIGRRVGHALHGAGSKGSKYSGSSTMTISQLKKQLCPNGDCGNLFDGYTATDRVDVQQFLNSITGEHGFGSWSDWHTTHYGYIKNKSDQWSMKSPTINLAGGIPTNANYKVGDFENGQPKISFASFQSMAESIFSAIPYRHYYDSSWKGSWLGALQAGACNCSDGADALIAFASACGFGGHKVHGTWDGEGHFWAVINGKPMDTTAWQKGYGWTSPKVHGYGMPVTRTAVPHDNNQTTNNNASPTIIVNINEPVYGVDELDSKIADGVDKGLQKHFNKSYAIGV